MNESDPYMTLENLDILAGVIEVCNALPLGRDKDGRNMGYLAPIMCDFHKNEFLMKWFPTLEAWDDFVHGISYSQQPEWHKENCLRCKGGESQVSK